MIFSLEVRRARKGDCLLMHFGTKETPGLAIIDGGPAGVYEEHLRPRLDEIRAIRSGADDAPLFVDLLMVSHVDDDHVHGILDLTGPLVTSPKRPWIRVQSIWHNSFEDLLGEDAATASTQFGTASVAGEFPEEALDESDEDDEVIDDVFKVLAGIGQGQDLRGHAKKLKWPLNPNFGGKLIIAGRKDWPVAEGLTFTVAGPMQPEIDALRNLHARWVEEQKKGKKSAAAALAAYADKSVANLSSIVVLAKSGGRSMLLTGDARGDRIIEGLKSIGLLQPAKSLHVDVLKVPHHGSANNVEEDFFRSITADHYVFSGDGEHGNPDRETMEMLFEARKGASFDVHLTYPIAEIDAEREKEWKKQQKSEKSRKAKRKAEGKPIKKEPREDWSDETHSLAAFFKKNRSAAGVTIHVVDDEEPHVIDLLEPLEASD